MTERIAGENLAAHHDHIADEPARKRDRRAGEERKSHELVAQHQDLAAIARRRRASTNSPNERLVIQKPAGRGEK